MGEIGHPLGQHTLKQTHCIPPAVRSHLGLAGRWLRLGRVGGRAEHDCIELAAELSEPLVLAHQLPRAVARCPIERLVSAYCFSLQYGTNHVPQFRLYQPPRAALTSFPSFCRNWLLSQDLNRIDYIFRPQAWWVADREQNLIVDQIIDISELDGWLESKGLQRPAAPAQRQRHNAVERDIFDRTMATIGNDLKVDIIKF